MPNEHELEVALRAVTRACRLATAIQHNLLANDTVRKSDRSPVTIADLAGQAVVNLELKRTFPNDQIVGEENSEQLERNAHIRQRVMDLVRMEWQDISDPEVIEAIGTGSRTPILDGRFWILDPIDGTKGFLRGEQYAVALGLIDQAQVVLGVLGCPNYPVDSSRPEHGNGCLFYAVKGGGAFMRELESGPARAILVDTITESSNARFCESVEKGHASHGVHAEISETLGISNPPFRIDSQAKYAAVARGDASIYLRLSRTSGYREKIWDHAAGSIVVEEAGGTVTDFGGHALDFSCGIRLEKNVGIVASNGRFHGRLLDAIARVIR